MYAHSLKSHMTSCRLPRISDAIQIQHCLLLGGMVKLRLYHELSMMAANGPHCDAMLDEISNGMTAIAEGRKVPDKCRIVSFSFFSVFFVFVLSF